jgi:hypothetical protein
MMPRSLVAVNLALAAVAAVLAVYIARQFLVAMPLPTSGRRAPSSAVTATATEQQRPPVAAYNVVASRNLFSPTRTEAASTAVATAAPVVKPNLFGVVVRENGSIAYLEDPTTKRVAGYRIGDRILGGTVQAIKGDVVTLDIPGGPMDVHLHDPGKPRAVPTAATATPPNVAPALPGVIPPVAPQPVAPAPQLAQPPVQPGQALPTPVVPVQPPVVGTPAQPNIATPPTIPGRRPIPPNLMRRVPPGIGDAPQQ